MSSWELKLGTRRSLLAMEQSTWVARELERLNPGLAIRLIGIETQGDRIQNLPLSKVEGKEFFVAEIDQALRSREVDLTVHSMKDLSLDRPQAFSLGAVPRRENPRDVILFGPSARFAVSSGKKLRIGTSSPRRLENIPAFLNRAIPVGDNGNRSALEFLEIRGNVNTRISRLFENSGSERHLDAVVLAFAGLIRLWTGQNGKTELAPALEQLRWMVLPLRQCPAAPAQGALAVECRSGDSKVIHALSRLHCADTSREVNRERQLLREWGGGCHQRFGATAIASDFGELFFIRGVREKGEFVDELQWNSPLPPVGDVRAWDGSRFRNTEHDHLNGISDMRARTLFVAHVRAARGIKLDPNSRIWTPGVSSWIKLADQGHWVEGCAEGLGFEFLRKTIREPVLKLPDVKDWTILTHEDAREGWGEGEVISTYRLSSSFDKSKLEEIERATHLYWSSGSQYLQLGSHASSQAHHSCGPGKTARFLREKGVSRLTVFPSPEEWRKWMGLH